MVLELQGDEVYVAHDGIEAIGKAQTRTPQAVLLDLKMPKMGGIDTARRLRALR